MLIIDHTISDLIKIVQPNGIDQLSRPPGHIFGHGKMQIGYHSIYSLSETVSAVYGRWEWEDWEEYVG